MASNLEDSTAKTHQHADVPVLIVGAGPSGATLALLLGRLGIKSLVLSKHRATANTPRAHIFNQRAMEVLRDAGLEPALREVACDAQHMQHTSWSNKLSGEEYGRMWAWGNKPSEKQRYETVSPCVMSDLPQSMLEPILVAEAVQAGADVRFGMEFLGFEGHTDHIEAVVKDRASGKEERISCQYLVGADGARSSVVEAAGIPVDGRQLNTAFNVHLRADLSRYMVNRPGSLNWVLNTEAPEWSAVGNFRMVRPWNEWVVSMHPAQKDGQQLEPTQEMIVNRLRQMVGDDSIPLEVLSTFRWTVNDQVAQRWQSGRVLCIGDAVHRHPPINGLGSNTCISDAFNLAWKLAYVIESVAGERLLDSLTIERKPVGDAVVRRANDGMEVHRRLWALLGLTPEARAEAVALLESPGIKGKQAREDLRQALDETDLEFQALGIQMNQIYAGSPVTHAELKDHPPRLDGLNLLKEAAVSTFPGYHLPHVWVAKNGQSPRLSTLDLCGQGRFTALTGIGGDCWLRACQEMNAAVPKLDVRGYRIGFRCDYIDCYGDWRRLSGVDEDGVVLVRPDHFVAWRFPTASSEACALLRHALSQILSNPAMEKSG